MPTNPDSHIIVREVGLRDGLQSIATILPTASKLAWCEREFAAGVSEIEVGSFVPPKLLPQMADTADVLVAALARCPGLTATVLVPNLKGAERGAAAGAKKLNFVMSASASHNWANVRRTVDDSLAEFERVVAFSHGLPTHERPVVSGGLATSFGCSIEGNIDEARVLALAVRLAELGAEEVVLADTVGYGNPAAVRRLFEAVRRELGKLPLAAHFHDTRGLGLPNVVAALDVGIIRFDASLGGLGGCPYAPGASGNIVMEDLVFLLESMGHTTSVDLAALLEVRRYVQQLLPGEALRGSIGQAGLPKNFRSLVAARQGGR